MAVNKLYHTTEMKEYQSQGNKGSWADAVVEEIWESAKKIVIAGSFLVVDGRREMEDANSDCTLAPSSKKSAFFAIQIYYLLIWKEKGKKKKRNII